MRVTLVTPPPEKIRERHDKPEIPHLGLGYLAAFLKAQDIPCKVIEAKFEGIDLLQLLERIKKEPPDIVGITAMTHEIGQAHKVAQAIKNALPNTLLVVGGAHATALPQATLAQFTPFDIAVHGEGEATLLEIVRSLEAGQQVGETIAGISFRRDSDILLTPPRLLLPQLDTLPFPAWELFSPSHSYPVMTSRGCPFHCNFCMRVMGGLVRKRSPENVLSEILRNVQFGAQHIEFTDETFAVDRKFAHQLLDLMLENGLPQKMDWTAETRVNLADLDLFRKMKASGCRFLGFGIESGNPQILKATRKGITLEQAEKAVSLAKKAGLRTGSFFILGHPGETKKTIKDTINFAIKLNTTRVAFGIMVPYPGTEIYDMARRGEGGYRLISSNWADFNKQIGNSLELEGVSRRDLERLQIYGYLSFYLRHGRILDLIKLLWKHRNLVFNILLKIKRRQVT